MILTPNTVVANRFRLNRVIGRGGMGSVWHATHLGLDIPCAVKFIEGTYAEVPEAQARFEREAKSAAQLRSPHVVQILDHGVWEGTPYLAMELLDGEDLGQRLKRVHHLHPKDVCVIIAQVTRALIKAHALGIVHRDLKPDNIFLVRDDDREVAKVLDFGIAKLTGALEGSSTRTGAMLGTPYYMSPEQAQGVKAVDHRSDLWSLAVIVYRAVTGVLPFESEALGDLLMRIIVAPIPIPSAMVHSLPPGFDAWWAKATMRDPALRFQSAKELLDALLLAFGQSQLTDVMDRAELRAVMGPSAPGPAPYVTPQPAVTPHPGVTPQPLFAPGAVAGHGMTGAPSAHTFGQAGGVPKNRAGHVAAILAGVVVLGASAVGGTFALTRASASHGATGASPATATMAAPSPQPPSPTSSAVPDREPASAASLAPSPSTAAVEPSPTASAPPAVAGTTNFVPKPTARPPLPGPAHPPGTGTHPPVAKNPGNVDLGI
ncbi:MAG TPA: protein kinase [Polyangiaceae bacterium]